MPLDRFPNIPFRLLEGLTGCNAAGQIGDVSSPIALCLLKNDGISLAHGFVSNPAAFKIDFNVPMTPVVRTCRQPSDSTSRIKFRTFNSIHCNSAAQSAAPHHKANEPYLRDKRFDQPL